jgi:hypothetical protein
MKGFLKIAGRLTLLGGPAVLEHRRRLRTNKASRSGRNARDLVLGTFGALTLHFESAALYPLAKKFHERRQGLPKTNTPAAAALRLSPPRFCSCWT